MQFKNTDLKQHYVTMILLSHWHKKGRITARVGEWAPLGLIKILIYNAAINVDGSETWPWSWSIKQYKNAALLVKYLMSFYGSKSHR